MHEPGASISLVGLHGGEWFGREAGDALHGATVVIGDSRHLAAVPADVKGRREELQPPLDQMLDHAGRLFDAGERVCIVVSGDPGFFGLARLAGARFGRALRIHPAPPSVSLAFARAGVIWDDAAVVSAHGRDSSGTDRAAEAALRHPKVAVLTSPSDPPEQLGRMLRDAGCGARRVIVASRLGELDESVWEGDIAGLADGRFDGLSVVLLLAPPANAAGTAFGHAAGTAFGHAAGTAFGHAAGTAFGHAAGDPGISWGLDEDLFEHRAGMITKAEVRAVALGKLGLPAAGVLWDVGAGSGSVSAECCRLAPGLRVFAVERRHEDAERARRNLEATQATVVEGEAPEVLSGLPDPDRVFIGGGGEKVLEEAINRLRRGGGIVATYAVLERAVRAGDRLGNLIQLSVARGVPSVEGGPLRLQAENPVFICWGSGADWSAP